MSIISSTVKIYDSNHTLIEPIPVLGDTMETTASSLSPGTNYYATVESIDDQQQSSGVSAPFYFNTLPQVNFIGYVTRDSSGFIRQMSNVTDSVQVIENGIVWDTNSGFTNPRYVAGTMVDGLDENTTYYYKPYCIDEFNRRWVNDQDTDSVTTLYAIPTIEWVSILGPTAGSFSATINVISSISVSSVVAEITTSGTTTTQSLTPQTGEQNIVITNLLPNTYYTIRIKATNTSGDGYSVVESFTTAIPQEEVEVRLMSGTWVDNSDNTISGQSVATFDLNEITITGHYIDMFDNNEHQGSPIDTYSGGALSSVTCTITGASPDTIYYMFGRVTYYVGSDSGTIYTQWSAPMQITTYSLLYFDSIEPRIDGADITFSVAGTSQNTVIEYSLDEAGWTTIPISDPQGETIQLTGLQSHITYYLRGMVFCAAGRTAYVTDRFDTN